jgi:hypothetical protein
MITVIVAGLLAFAAQGEADGKPKTPEEQYQALFNEYEAAYRAYVEANYKAKTEEDLAKLDAHPGRNPRGFAAGFMTLARKYPGSSAAEDALVWVASHVIYGTETEEAKRILIRDHIRSAKLAPIFALQWWGCGSEATERLLRESLARSALTARSGRTPAIGWPVTSPNRPSGHARRGVRALMRRPTDRAR